jgi:hypothetical protein
LVISFIRRKFVWRGYYRKNNPNSKEPKTKAFCKFTAKSKLKSTLGIKNIKILLFLIIVEYVDLFSKTNTYIK